VSVSATVYLTLLAAAIGYLLGSIPTAYVMTRLRKGVDIRQVGSHNMGAMNVLRTVGPMEAIAVLFIDAAKGIAAVVIARALELPVYSVLVAAAAAVAGHDFTVFLRFHGGKGGATSLGILLFLLPWSAPYYFAVTGLLLLFLRNLTFAYGVAFVVFPVMAWLIYHSNYYGVFALVVVGALGLENLRTAKDLMHMGVREAMARRMHTQ
jgi:glycerol-3-phosphate acyltransferase PlsY